MQVNHKLNKNRQLLNRIHMPVGAVEQRIIDSLCRLYQCVSLPLLILLSNHFFFLAPVLIAQAARRLFAIALDDEVPFMFLTPHSPLVFLYVLDIDFTLG
jgi:hypothetical protein